MVRTCPAGFAKTHASPMGWSVKDGILMNEGKEACNIYTQQKFNDFKLDVEFNVDPREQQRGLSPRPV